MTSILHAKSDVKAFMVPLFLTNRLLDAKSGDKIVQLQNGSY